MRARYDFFASCTPYIVCTIPKFEYKTILLLLKKFHDIKALISISLDCTVIYFVIDCFVLVKENHSKNTIYIGLKVPLLTNGFDDTNTSQRVSIVLLNEFNFLWSRVITIALGRRSKLGFINSFTSHPDVDDLEYEVWLSKYQLVMSWILNSNKRNLVENFSYSKSSLDLWNVIHNMYGSQNNSGRIFQSITRSQVYIRMKDLLFNYWIAWKACEINLRYITHALLMWLYYEKRTNEDQFFQLLASLSLDFKDLRSHILMNPELSSLQSVCITI